MSIERQRLEAEATKLLRRHGFTCFGTAKKQISPKQLAFERRLICTAPPGSGKKRH